MARRNATCGRDKGAAGQVWGGISRRSGVSNLTTPLSPFSFHEARGWGQAEGRLVTASLRGRAVTRVRVSQVERLLLYAGSG